MHLHHVLHNAGTDSVYEPTGRAAYDADWSTSALVHGFFLTPNDLFHFRVGGQNGF